MAASEFDLATLAAVKTWLNFADGNNDNNASLAALITGASLAMQKYVNRTIPLADYDHRQDGNGSNYMVCRNSPVQSITSITVDGAAIPAANISFEDSTIYLSGRYVFTRGRGNVALVYTAGFDDVPPDLVQACIDLVALRWRERDRIGQSSKGLANETTTFSLVDFPPQVKTLLQQYMRVAPV